MFTFSTLLGALSESTASQSLLELDGGVKVLVDVGWDESFDTKKLEELEKQVPTISLILLTHATISHLGAYAHCCKNFPQFARIPVYATKPVKDLGRVLVQDLYASAPQAATTIPQSSLAEASYSYTQSLSTAHNFLRQAPTHEEISQYFQVIQAVSFQQSTTPGANANHPPLSGLTITAYRSGRTLGGTIWHLQHGLESIVYGVDWGQYKENIYGGAAWIEAAHGGGSEVIEQLRKPTALVSSTRSPNVLRPDARDADLLAIIKACAMRGGTVLIPVDSSARVLEMAYLLEHAWRKDSASDAPSFAKSKLYLVGRSVQTLLYQTRTVLDWMNENILEEFGNVTDGSRRQNGTADGARGREGGPFDFKHLRLLERKAQVERILAQDQENQGDAGKVILASDTSLEWGFSRDVFRSIADDPKNLVVMSEVPTALLGDKVSLARTLWEWWNSKKYATDEGQVDGAGREVDFTDATKQALDGEDLALYQQWLATQRQLQATMQTGASSGGVADMPDDESDSETESEGSDNERQGKSLNVSTALGQAARKKVVLTDEDLGITVLIKRTGRYDFDVRGKKGRERMFPLTVRRKKNDDFGELVRPEEYLREEEREEERQDAGYPGRGEQREGLGRKRKWDDIGGNTKGSTGPNKRPPLSRLASGDDLPLSASPDGPVLDELDTVEDKEEEPVLGPSRLVTATTRVPVRLRIAYVDFSGLHTERNLEMLLPLVQPRKLILVGGSVDETAVVSKKFKGIVSKSRGVPEDQVDVFTPSTGTTVDASVDTNAWVVKLADPLVKHLKWQNLRGLGIVTITGQLLATAKRLENGTHRGAEDEDSANKRQKTEGGDDADSHAAAAEDGIEVVPTIDLLPAAMSSATRSAAQPLHVGELRLADLRRAMQLSGHTAEFRGEGTLVIDGSVAVKKTTAGRVELESIGLPTDGGPAMQMGGTFYAVRKMIYDGLAVVAGG